MKHRPGLKHVPLLEFFRTQPIGVEIPWTQLNQLADHDVKRSRGALIMVKAHLEREGLTLGGQTPTGIQVVPL